MGNFFLPSGYLNFEFFYGSPLPYQFLILPRGTGKTYGALKYAMDHDIKIMYMRRTQKQADTTNNPLFSPYKTINRDCGTNIQMKSVSKDNAMIVDCDEDGNVIKEIGYTCALSTIATMRGFDSSDISVVVYDEALPEVHERPIKEEAAALFNAMETIGRNREMQGKPPLKLLFMGNSNNITADVLRDLKIVGRIRKMQNSGIDYWQDYKRGIAIFCPNETPITEGKAQTRLYSLTKGTKFADMALYNKFNNDDFGTIASRPLNEYKALVKVGKVTVMRHKSQMHYYVTMHKTECPHYYEDTRIELARFRSLYPWLYTTYMNRGIIFEDEQSELLFREYIRA